MNLVQNSLRKPAFYYSLVGIFLILFPFINDERQLLMLFTQIFIFAVLAMSYDLLLGFTGIVSFGHAMFFGIGAYSTAVILDRMDATYLSLVTGIIVGIIIAAIVSLIVGVLSLRLKSHFYAMLTLAFAGLFLVAAQKWRSVTGGNDGFTFSIPDALKEREVLYFTTLLLMILVFFGLKRFTNSPVGKVLQAIRENESRTESLGYKILHYKVFASIVAGIVASISGSFYVLTLRFVNTSVFTMDITLDALLMTIIGGVGTLVGAIIGAGLIEWAHHWLTDLSKVHWIFERWIIFFGIIYILAVMFFPKGIVGTLREWFLNRKKPEKVTHSEQKVDVTR
ncbi:branched-chain amino acid transport system permease protein [Bacillus mesophilus]|uniref:Branched-chain amino acid ABC transporter permease n=1 Tax=Bacillus mesophilus TaxID=1808955 RepID=A0A6M0Q3F6_9BACI|nr:branched-chain amino acid ABC transporter permease [Bacillus mesophilus]MBM7659834.1 branched-chain amino acid transport system permease protein [Bacillus mesophilus]NEY70693.1 branched-chain amino acid ABC transporter permease [Bacillus mesophilus]